MNKVAGDGLEWAVRLGQRQRAREEAAARVALMEQETTDRVFAETRAAWRPLVEAVSGVIAAYNSGAGHQVLTVAEDPGPSDQMVITVACCKEGHPSLSARLDGAFICVSARDARGASHNSEHRMVSGKSADGTAAYLLQNWLEQL